MPAFLEREVLGGSQRIAGRQQALHAGLVGQVQEHRGVAERAARLHRQAELLGGVVRHADAGEHDGETLRAARAAQACALRDLRGEPVVRQAARREQRQLLAAHEAVHDVDRADAGLDEVARQRAPRRVDREALDAHACPGGDGRAAVDRSADAVEHAPEQVRADAEQQRLRVDADARAAEAEPRRSTSSTSMTIEASSSAATRPRRGAPVGADSTSTAAFRPDASCAPCEQQRAFDARDGVFEQQVSQHGVATGCS